MQGSVSRTQNATQTPFDNSTNGFSAQTVQTAIEEARTNPAARISIVTTFNGSIGNNQWLGYNQLLPGNTVPIRIPWSCTLKDLSFSFVGAAVDGVFSLYKNGTLAGNIVYTNTFTNVNGGKNVVNINIPLLAGDFIVGRWTDTGDNPSDLALTYFLLLS